MKASVEALAWPAPEMTRPKSGVWTDRKHDLKQRFGLRPSRGLYGVSKGCIGAREWGCIGTRGVYRERKNAIDRWAFGAGGGPLPL